MDEDFDEIETVWCPACDTGEGVPLGNLGRKEWFRCRDCGIDFSRDKQREEDFESIIQGTMDWFSSVAEESHRNPVGCRDIVGDWLFDQVADWEEREAIKDEVCKRLFGSYAETKESSMNEERIVNLIAKTIADEIRKDAEEAPQMEESSGTIDLGGDVPEAPQPMPEGEAPVAEQGQAPSVGEGGYVFGDIQSFMVDVGRWAKEEKAEEGTIYDIVMEYSDDILDWVYDEITAKKEKGSSSSDKKEDEKKEDK